MSRHPPPGVRAENPFAAHLAASGCVVLDGGLATTLESRGYALHGKLWSARLIEDDPYAVREAHEAFLRAGADCITTVSYQATLRGLTDFGLSRSEAEAALLRSTRLAREAYERVGARHDAPPSIVAASVGPYGAWLADGSEYDGRYGLSRAELRAFHAERFALLAASGADVLACETLPSLEEVRVLLGLLDETPDTWAWFSFTCVDGGTLRDGTPVEEAAALCGAHGRVAAVGVNCTEPHWVGELIERIRPLVPGPVLAYPNSGEGWDASRRRWSPSTAGVGREGWLRGLAAAWRAGARVLGGCCRIGPDDVAELRERVDGGDLPAPSPGAGVPSA